MKSIFILSIFILIYGCHKDNLTAPVSTTTNYAGTNGVVYAFTIYNGDLVIGGNFTMAGKIIAQNIVLWDGNNWSALGDLGTRNSFVTCLTVYRGQLIAGLSDGSIMQWDGKLWTSVGKVFSSDVSIRIFGEYSGNLIVAGNFDSLAGVKVSNIAQWNGTDWSTLGVGVNSSVSSLTIYNQNLIVATHNNIEQWNGILWTSIGKTDLSTGAQALCADTTSNILIAVGNFDSIGGVFASCAAEWNGMAWVALDRNYDVYSAFSINIFKGNIVIVCEYGGISSLSGNTWRAIGSTYQGGKYMTPGFNYASIVYNGYMYVGGQFYSLENGVLLANYIARWNGTNWSAL